ncbi:fez family zinc finger protein 2-like [Trichogramma pretiosum]|uniref:fez family zinc finger protein 2-like n=1 Tax=Trichogramma pretiosum TaxID=7493 RepID=UPI0006C96A15|nr:fez family zinc finger protein 2-like [Trichogramma pretiosum]
MDRKSTSAILHSIMDHHEIQAQQSNRSFTPRVKEEPIDKLTTENNDGEIIDETSNVENAQFPKFSLDTYSRERSLRNFSDYNQETEENDGLEVEIECKDVKPDLNLLKIEQTDNYSTNYLQNAIKLEPIESVKNQFVNTKEIDSTAILDSQLNQTNKTSIAKYSICINTLKSGNNENDNSVTHMCEICGKIFSSKSTLNRHIQETHEVHKGVKHKCDKCGKCFLRKYQFEAHIISHNDPARDIYSKKVTKLVCKICGNGYGRMGDLNRHVNAKHNDITFECDICKRKFTQKSHLQDHIQRHHNPVERELDICQISRNNANRFICEICNKKFSRMGVLNRHVDTIHNNKRFECTVCGREFTQNGHLKDHMKKCHGPN